MLHKVRWHIFLPMHHPWLWIFLPHNIQYPVGMLQICLPPLGPCLCPGHLSMDDGPNPGTLQRCNWNCRWCCHPQTWWQRAWSMPTHTHAGCQRAWACLQWWKMCSKTAINQIFGLDLWQGWHTPRPLQACCHSQHVSPRDTTTHRNLDSHSS